MEDEKDAGTKTRYKSPFSWLPKLQFGKTGAEASVAPVQAAEQPKRKKKPWWVHVIRWSIAAVVVVAIKVYFFGGWPVDGEYTFKVLNEPAPAAEGTVCDLFRVLEEEQSALLLNPGEKVIYHQDTVSESGVESSIVIKTFGQAAEPETTAEKPQHQADVQDIDLNQLIHFEAMTHGQARLIFADGNCEVYDLGAVLRLLRAEDECHLFQAIPFDGQKYEYFNIMYTEAFEKINCEEGTFYRARLNISKARCPSVHSLMNCGTDFFSKHIYSKLRKRLEFMDPNNSYRYQREYELYPCKCYEGEMMEFDPEVEFSITVEDG